MRISPHFLLLILSLAASMLGARFYAHHSIAASLNGNTSDATSQQTISTLERKIDQLEGEVSALKSLLHSGSALTIDPQLIAFVEKDLNLKFLHPPRAVSVDEDFLHESVGQSWLSAFGETGMQMRSYAFEKVGILPPNQNFTGQLIIAEATGSRGFYDTTSGEIQLLDTFDAENIHHQASLVRLLALSLLDQHCPVPKVVTDDALLARASIHRGRASLLQQRFYTLQARQIGFVSEPPNQDAIETFSSLPHYVRLLTTFPSQQGASFVTDLSLKDSDSLSKFLLHPPTSCRTLLPDPPTIVLPPLPEDESTQLATRLGPVAAMALTSRITESSEAPAWMADFHLDLFTITLKGQSQHPIVVTAWETHWKSTDAASSFAAIAKDIIEAENPSATVTLKDKSVIISAADQDIPTGQ